jgi:acyl carrier protein
VQDAVVLAREDAAGDKRVVAYVSPQAADPARLRQYLKARLPAYMMPSAFVPMEKLPLTPNGKLDRQALAGLPCESAAPARAVDAPRSDTEKALAALWAGLLGVETVGIHEDLFDLGAHSLMAMKALTQIRDAFEVSLSLRNLFEHPTIAGLAEAIDGLAWLAKAGSPGQDGGREEVVL